MARFSRGKRKTNASIKSFYNRARLLAAKGIPSSLKLTMMGFSRRGGYLLKQEKLRRKLPPQLKGVNNRTKTGFYDEGMR